MIQPSHIKLGLFSSSSQSYFELRRQWAIFEKYPQVDSLWLSDHIVKAFEPEGAYRHSWSLLPALAAATNRCNLGVLVSANTFRHPSILVRQAITVDEISLGRLVLGIGAGWYKAEHEILGVPFPKRPIQALESALQIINQLLYNEVTHELLTLDYPPIRDAIIRPRPLREMPILVGGHGPKVIELASRYGHIYNTFGTPQEVHERYLHLCSVSMLPPQMTCYIHGGLGYPLWSSIDAFETMIGDYGQAGCTGFIIDAPKQHQLGIFEKCLTTLKAPTE